jgi:hypothetical protein
MIIQSLWQAGQQGGSKIISDTTIVKLVSMISFFVGIVANTGRGEAAFPSKTIFVKNVEKKVECVALYVS